MCDLTLPQALQRIEDLEFELRELRREWACGSQAARVGAIRARWPALDRAPAIMLLYLFDRAHVVIDRNRLIRAVPHRESNEFPDPDMIKIYAHAIRQNVHRDAIRTERGLGYAITPLGIEAVNGALVE
jgi:DNA-binding response OmpR family regulator